jgi:hypothetical protein
MHVSLVKFVGDAVVGSKTKPVLWTGSPGSPKRTWAENDGASAPSNAFGKSASCGDDQELLHMV